MTARIHCTKKEHGTRQERKYLDSLLVVKTGLHGLLVSKQDPVDDLDDGQDGDS